jgi:hypothetical protein
MTNLPTGSATVSGGLLILNGARARPNATFSAGHSLEFVATFSGDPSEHIGFGETFEHAPWAIFSTTQTPNTFAASTNVGSHRSRPAI